MLSISCSWQKDGIFQQLTIPEAFDTFNAGRISKNDHKKSLKLSSIHTKTPSEYRENIERYF